MTNMGTHNKGRQLVYTVKDRCRVCYTCVRECPVKAIRIINGQAEVISDRCIGCGNCVKVCSQQAKQFLDTTGVVLDLLREKRKKVAIIAPSFPAEFTEIADHEVLAGMIRELGFDHVLEVSFGADMVAGEYSKLLSNGTPDTQRYISSDCPAIVNFITFYHPGLVENLAPIASPMVALARIAPLLAAVLCALAAALVPAHTMLDESSMNRGGERPEIVIVFIGPCIAKKAESDEISEAITFRELRKIFEEKGIRPEKVRPVPFDEPHSAKGAIFPVSRGLLQTANKKDDICEGNILVAEGKENFKEAVKEFEKGLIETQHLELLCCDGCIMGPGMSNGGKKFERTIRISNYAKKKLDGYCVDKWKEAVGKWQSLDFSEKFNREDKPVLDPDENEIRNVLKTMGKESANDQLNCGACGYKTCREHAIAIIDGLAENEMCLPYTIEKLHKSIEELNYSNENLASARQALRQSEKLASMGQLSAGIAHELNNPLGVITMYSNILMDETPKDHPMYQDLKLIVEQTERCKSIVGGLLNFARKNQVRLVETDIDDFVKKSMDSILHDENIKLVFHSGLEDPMVMIDRDQMMQVLTNLEKNAVEAMEGTGGELRLEVSGNTDEIVIAISDKGGGISEEHMEKIFTPFFTTKGVGKGTGLGLPLVYGIVKMHKGQIKVTSNADPGEGPTGTTFTITLPRTG